VYDVVVKGSRSLSHLLMSFLLPVLPLHGNTAKGRVTRTVSGYF